MSALVFPRDLWQHICLPDFPTALPLDQRIAQAIEALRCINDESGDRMTRRDFFTRALTQYHGIFGSVDLSHALKAWVIGGLPVLAEVVKSGYIEPQNYLLQIRATQLTPADLAHITEIFVSTRASFEPPSFWKYYSVIAYARHGVYAFCLADTSRS